MGRDQGRVGVLEDAGVEFHYRHPITRRLVMLSLALPGSGRAIEVAGRPLSVVLTLLGLRGVADRVLAGVFNLAYWRGVADELGGRDRARGLILAQAAAAAATMARPASNG